MKTILFFILLFSATSLAQVDVSCWNGSCLNNGWTWKNYGTGQSIDHGCYRDGCEISGWIIGNLARKTYTQCKNQNCFKNGWYEIDQQTQNVVREIVCRANGEKATTNCFEHGWVSYTNAGIEAVTTCRGHDCRYQGWTQQDKSKTTRVQCKDGGCFESGWSEF